MQKYSSIRNLTIKEVDEVPKDIVFVATEKLHGANMSFVVSQNAESVNVASRNRMLTIGDSFYEWERVLDNIKPKLRAISRWLHNDEFILYGEIIGGSARTSTRPVQKEVYYKDWYDFQPFDIWYNDRFLPYKIASRILLECEFLPLPVLHVGTLEQLAKLDPCFESPYPFQVLGDHKPKNNIAEGYIFRPYDQEHMDETGRMIFKHKNQKFKENKGTKTKPSAQTVETLDPCVFRAVTQVEDNITENRLKNVLSHFPEFENKLIGDIIKEFQEDIFDNVMVPNVKGMDRVKGTLKGKAAKFVRERLDQIRMGSL